MDKLLLAVGGIMLVWIILFLAAIFATIFGALGGLIVGWLFDATSIKVLTFVGLESFAMWEIGAALGFFGNFFRSTRINKNK